MGIGSLPERDLDRPDVPTHSKRTNHIGTESLEETRR
jgi:hypothetical protein